jgi:dGTPase
LRADLFALDDLAEVPLARDILDEIRAAHPELEPSRRAHELVRRLITRLIEDVAAETERRLRTLAPGSVADVRRAGAPVAGFSPDMANADQAIKDFLRPRMYRHPRVARIMGEAEEVVCDLVTHYAKEPDDLPPEWRPAAGDAAALMRRTADFIAGMTDRYALIEHARFFDSTPELR